MKKLKHLEDIETFVKLLVRRDAYNGLIIQSPPGWSKSTTVNAALKAEGVPYKAIGSYSTPLAFYNALCENKNRMIVLDDCSGLFTDLAAMATLKAATWPSTGSGQREITWNSTSTLVQEQGIVFTGKLILMTNVFPKGPDTEAFLSRCLFYKFSFNRSEVAKMLLEASTNTDYYEDTELSKEVALFLISQLYTRDYTKFNLRTLMLGYELATVHPKGWKEMIFSLLPQLDPIEVVAELDKDKETSTEDKVREFIRQTGLSRRSFFLYRESITKRLEDTAALEGDGTEKTTLSVPRTTNRVPARKFDETEFMELYKSGMPFSAMAKKLNVSTPTLTNYASRLGLRRSGSILGKEKEISKLYKSGQEVPALAKKFGVHENTIRNLVKKQKIRRAE